MNNSTNQLFKEIDFLVDELGMTADQTDEILQACDQLGGIGAEYFCEEFIFCPDESTPDDIERWHNELYLTIPQQLRLEPNSTIINTFVDLNQEEERIHKFIKENPFLEDLK